MSKPVNCFNGLCEFRFPFCYYNSIHICRFNNARADIANNFASGRYFDDYWESGKKTGVGSGTKSSRVKFSIGPGDSATGEYVKI